MVMNSLLRYNVRILLGNTVWLLVVPIASSQLIVIWQMALATTFNEVVAAKTSELLASLWAALLCAHVLAQEYRSQLSEITFSKPISVNRIVLMRLAAIFCVVGVLITLTLAAYTLWLQQPFDFFPVLFAGIPSTLFLGMMALLLTAMWRNPMMGFGAAAIYWALDWVNGMSLNPLFTLHSFAESKTVNPLAQLWMVNKVVLLITTVVLYLAHGRIVARPAGLRTWRTMAKSAGIPIGLFLIVLLGGAVYKVYLGLREESQFPDRAWAWYDLQFKVYGSFPVAWMFGPAFANYADKPFPGVKMRNLYPDRPEYIGMRMTRWRVVSTRYPRSHWAGHSLYELGEECESVGDPNSRPQRDDEKADVASFLKKKVVYLKEAADSFERLARQYPESVFAPVGLSHLEDTVTERLKTMDNRPSHWMRKQRWARETLIKRYPDHPKTWRAARKLADEFEKENRLEENIPLLRRIANRAPIVSEKIEDHRPSAYLFLARKLTALHKPDEAHEMYQRALQSAREGILALQRDQVVVTQAAKIRILPEMEEIMRQAQREMGEQ
jgi:hypothetical protein